MAINEDGLQEYTLKDFRKNMTMIMGDVQHGQKRVKITSYGRTTGYFISEAEMQYLETLEDAVDIQTVEALKAAGADKAVRPWQEVKKELNL
jgi:hypothetical protein